ncbi:hypothetical protein H0274_14940 [Altererythrobacter sp. CC-YST694]|uniref:hypothetical protein n=1 Tax=Altererythrobacter sp. CC-YST694 TaxID=2755038 RepID=UPI001D00284D|nr:hypothetical protein [Altererythrobacter sp. CC-YST694]MCB5426556.1 hypothetical protein [Altererythrobacter sp. CC-YST694]
MFGPRLTTVFASRWKALWWAGVVLVTAYCSIPAPEDTPDPAARQAAQPRHVNPWAKKTGAPAE